MGLLELSAGSWYHGSNLIPQVKVLPRADKNKDFDPEKWTLVVVEQGIGDQILFKCDGRCYQGI